MKHKNAFIAMLFAECIAVTMTACSTADGAQVPEGRYSNSRINASMTLKGTSVNSNYVWTGPGAGSVTGTANISDVWTNISNDRASGGYYWQATINFCDSRGVCRSQTGLATKNGRTIRFAGYNYTK